MELPIEAIDCLMSEGFYLNSLDSLDFKRTCLDTAAENYEHNAIRLLVHHSAKSYTCYTEDNSMSQHHSKSRKSPIALLASQPNVPLDLFDLLATPQNLNDCSQYKYLPLHEAASCGRSKIAVHLIKLGASVDQKDGFSLVPIWYYLEDNRGQLEYELLLRLLPSKVHMVYMLKLLCKILDKDNEHSNVVTHLREVLHQLLQRVHFDGPLKVKTRDDNDGSMEINGNMIASAEDSRSLLCSGILIELQCDLTLTSNYNVNGALGGSTKQTDNNQLKNVLAFQHVWRNYTHNHQLKSLLQLCILQIRTSMHSLDDQSFLSLPVPPYIRGLLTYHDVSEKIFDGWCRGGTMFC